MEILAEILAALLVTSMVLAAAGLVGVAVLMPIMHLWRQTFPRRSNGRHHNNGGTHGNEDRS